MTPPMVLRGIGAVTCRGRGLGRLEAALRDGWIAPRAVPLRHAPGREMPAYEVTAEDLADKDCLKTMRRADRFSRLAAVAASDAVRDAGPAWPDPNRVGVIVATAFGPHVTTFKFLEDILQYGDAGVSPTVFSHSVHNAAAAYIAKMLELRGPALTLAQFSFAFHQALIMAQDWLGSGRCDAVLVGAADERGEAMDYVSSRRLTVPADGRIRPFDFSASAPAVPGEAAAFFVLDRREPAGAYGVVESVTVDDPYPVTPDVAILDADGFPPDQRPYAAAAAAGVPLTAFSPLFGSLFVGSALSLACAAVMLRGGRTFPPPVPPPGGRLPLCTGGESPRRIACVRCDCDGRIARLTLSRQ